MNKILKKEKNAWGTYLQIIGKFTQINLVL